MNYRALISVPITAPDDREAVERAVDFANSLTHPGSDVIAGHVELVGETMAQHPISVGRVVLVDALLGRQVP